MSQTKLPSFQFYPGDWMKDPSLRSVGLAAQGLWINMLCLMHEARPRGYLQHATGKPVTAEQLARMTGGSTDEVSRLLQELFESGVYSRTVNDVIFSRRIVRDERIREARSTAGKKGGDSTAVLLKQNAKQTASKPAAKGTAKSGSSSSASSSTSISSAYAENGGANGPPARAAPPAGNEQKKTAVKKESRAIRTDEERRVFNRFRQWFCEECYPRHFAGDVYTFDDLNQRKRRRNYRFCWKFLKEPVIGFDLAKAQQTAECAMSNIGALNGSHYCPFEELTKNAAQWWWKSNRKETGDAIKLANVRPGEFQQQRRPLPEFGAGGAAAAAG